MLISLTEKQVGVLKYVLESEIERLEDKATTEEYDKCYERASYWRLRAFEIKKNIREDMKTLQNNFTTSEQSKRLLELGVPANSADLYSSLGFENLIWIRNTKGELNEDFFDALINGKSAHIPIWSVGRLIEIRNMCAKYLITHADFVGNYMENIIMSFYAIHATNGFNFSKLEE